MRAHATARRRAPGVRPWDAVELVLLFCAAVAVTVAAVRAASMSGDPAVQRTGGSAAADSDARARFSAYLRRFAVALGPSEFEYRLAVFLDNERLISAHNANGSASFRLGINHFAHLTHAEFRGGGHSDFDPTPWTGPLRVGPAELSGRDLPAASDWRSLYPSVRNQGKHPDCWAMAAADAILGGAVVQRRARKSLLSSQQLVDCVYPASDHNYGKGGDPATAMRYAQRNGGLCTEAAYPYVGKWGACALHGCRASYPPRDVLRVPSGNETALVSAVANQPVAVAVQASSRKFQFYKSGVFDDPGCGRAADHAVVLVGYGTDPGEKPYFLLRNSWGAHWGEDGYMRLVRGARDPVRTCGVTLFASFPVMLRSSDAR